MVNIIMKLANNTAFNCLINKIGGNEKHGLECRLVDCNVAGSGGKSRNAQHNLNR